MQKLFKAIWILFTVCSKTVMAQDSLITLNHIENKSMLEHYYVEPGSIGTKREGDPPSYIRNVSKIGLLSPNSVAWLDLGLDSRIRAEWRHNDIRRSSSFSNDYPFLLRQRIYAGIVHALDPIRFAIEFEDARQVNSNFARDTRDFNKTEIIQVYGELFFKGALGKDKKGNYRPLSIRFGRMAFEFLDRRLIALNRWRNTTNTFVGLKAALGKDQNDWQVDVLIVKPIIRNIEKIDKKDKNRLFSAVIGHWRKWSHIVTIEPYFMSLKQTADSSNNQTKREVHGTGMRLYGRIPNSNFNYDITGMYQFGKDNGENKQAYNFTSEVGYTFNSLSWKPRASAFFGYVSGDKNPNDSKNHRFERFFGFSRPWSADDYVVMENILTPKLKIQWQYKHKSILFKFDGGYSYYWLASRTDRFNNFLEGTSNNRDRSGNSGNFLGHGLDFHTVFSPVFFLNLDVGYAHFTNGKFVEYRQIAANGFSAPSTDFIYIELSINLLDFITFYHNQKQK